MILPDSLFIMKPAFQDLDRIGCHRIYQAVLFVYPAGPTTGKISLQRLGFSDSIKRRSFAILYQFVNPFQDFLICVLPMKVVIPPFIVKD